MKYNIKAFNSAVSEYKNRMNAFKGKSFFVYFDIENTDAFFSVAPLSRAVHELGGEMCAVGVNKKNEAVGALLDVWTAFESKKGGKCNALADFIKEAVKKCGREFIGIFRKPDCILKSSSDSFGGTIKLPFKAGWFKEYRTRELEQTMSTIWKDVYNLKQNERVGIGFVLIQKDEMLGHPLEDYLDSYAIIRAAVKTCKGRNDGRNDVTVSSSTARASMSEKCENAADLRATLMGCELEKDIDEPVFKKYKKASELLRLGRIKPADATFFIDGKGYPGKHIFGERIGYPTLNKRSRWQSPGQLVYKLDFYPQTKFEDREPVARVGFTETLPIDILIESSLVDWSDIRARNQRLKDVMDKCDVIYVRGKLKEKYVTSLEVGIVKKDGTRRWIRRSDTDIREKINKDYLKMTGIKAGNMANIPGGEAFVTPEYIKGIFVGDVVVHIDQSYALNKENPLVVKCNGDSYKIIDGPKEIIKKISKKKNDALKQLLEMEKHKSLPKEIIELNKRNFERIGEFAINTNPKARLCEYLIVNEKIAKMMHIALGSGFEPDRSTVYHMDIVFNAPRQKLNAFGIDKKGNAHWILKNGRFVF